MNSIHSKLVAWLAIAGCLLAMFCGQPWSTSLVSQPASSSRASGSPHPADPWLGHFESPGQEASHFLNRYCMECHQGENAAGDIDLQSLASHSSLDSDDRELWEQVLEAVDQRYMPPADHGPQPAAEEIQQIKDWYLSQHDEFRTPRTRSTIRRLNRTEYENTIRDLLQLQASPFQDPQRLVLNDQYFQPESGSMPPYVMVFSHFEWAHRHPVLFEGLPLLPEDPPVEHGFDNSFRGLSFSPLQMERYCEFANKLLNHPEFPTCSGVWESLFTSNKRALPDLARAGKVRLREFLPRAFRRPVTRDEVNRWADLFQRQLQQHRDFTEAMKSTVWAVLVSPHFLFRLDATDDAGPQSWTIASRLSYFLWNSMPDDELLRAAIAGNLQEEQGLRKQIRRMLSDPRARSLSTSFGAQWLKSLKAVGAQPDKDLFEDYYFHRRLSPPGVSMAIEQMLLFESILVENRSVLEFVDADFGYVNGLLMDWYGLDPVSTIGFVPDPSNREDFFRIRWPDKTRGGVISAGATLLSTSATDRTSPVYRGEWILDVLFNRPPPPPPADAPALSPLSDLPGQTVTMRQRLAIHRANPNCAVCHDQMDPLGFSLEEFDAVGRFRSVHSDGTAIDCLGEVAGVPVRGVVELKTEVLRQAPRFVGGLVEHLMEYSLGRSLQMADQDTVREILKVTSADQFRFRDLIEEVAVQTLRSESTAREVPIWRLSGKVSPTQ